MLRTNVQPQSKLIGQKYIYKMVCLYFFVKTVEYYLGRVGGERHERQVFTLLREVIVGDSEAQHLREVSQLLLSRHSLTWNYVLV